MGKGIDRRLFGYNVSVSQCCSARPKHPISKQLNVLTDEAEVFFGTRTEETGSGVGQSALETAQSFS